MSGLPAPPIGLPLRRRSRRGIGRPLVLAALATVSAATAVAAAPEPAQRLTLLEGSARVVDGARASAAVPGLALAPGAIVETAADSRLVRIEFADGSVADLGPQSRVMVAPRGFAPREGKAPALYLLDGWVKQIAAPDAPAAGLATPGIDLLPFTGAVVVNAAAGAHRVFVESGRARLQERRRGGATVAVSGGEMYAADSGLGGTVTPRPGADFVAAMPRMFRDRIPSQAARFKDASVVAPALPPPDYAALHAWLAAEPLIRRDFPRRFAVLARQRPFRTSLEEGLAQFPEWRPVLYPPPPPPPPQWRKAP